MAKTRLKKVNNFIESTLLLMLQGILVIASAKQTFPVPNFFNINITYDISYFYMDQKTLGCQKFLSTKENSCELVPIIHIYYLFVHGSHKIVLLSVSSGSFYTTGQEDYNLTHQDIIYNRKSYTEQITLEISL